MESYLEWHNNSLLVNLKLHKTFLVGKLTFKLITTWKLNESLREKTMKKLKLNGFIRLF